MSTKRNIHGVLLLDKPIGMSSNRALQMVKHLIGAKKAGHTGSLDPLATGLLPVCLGQATKVSEYLLNSHKKYTTTIKLGETTDTLDSEGEVLETKPVNVSEEQLAAALCKFRGEIEQIPPMYSALKKDGQPLYKLARKGQTIERKARQMTVFDLQAERLSENRVELKVHCSSGFYIRTLADDLGQELGCGAHVVALRRTAIKSIAVEEAVTLDALQQMSDIMPVVQPIDCLIPDFPVLKLDQTQLRELEFGRRVTAGELNEQGLCRFVRPDGSLFGVGEITAGKQLKTHKMFVLAE